jgi:hypothetical protein
VPYTVTGLLPNLSGLPSACPISAWAVSIPTSLPTVSPKATDTIPVPVSMVSGAPNSCQSAILSIPFRVLGTLR